MRTPDFDSRLRSALKENADKIEAMLDSIEWLYEDGLYRFYHQSFKVYHLQEATKAMVALFRELVPDKPLNGWFLEIVAKGTGKEFDLSHNRDWLTHTRPVVEAFLHCKYFLEMMQKVSRHEKKDGMMLPVYMAGVLYLYNER